MMKTMMKTSIIDDARESALVLKAWLVSVLVIAILGSAKQDAGNNEHSVRKLVADEHPGFINIDCGATDDYLDEGTGFFYQSDSRFIDTGTNNQISSEYNAIRVPTRQLKTLRSFPQGKKNCYTLKPMQGKNNNYLIRAFFLYGNYDDKNQTQKYEFQLYVGVNYCITVTVDQKKSYYEVIHSRSADFIFVCLKNTQSGVPFISALELRLVDKHIYLNDYGKALLLASRFDLGNTSGSDSVRYPGAVFDRFWDTTSDGFISKSVPISTSSDIDTNDSNNIYKLPAQVLSTAIKPASGYTLHYDHRNYDGDSYNEYYVCFHFAEIEELKEGEIREFFIDVNEGSYISEPITLQYLQPKSVCPNQTFEGHFNFIINATAKSNLPPLLNALEIYGVRSLPDYPTDPGDVAAIMEIKQTTRRADWQGDPCVPNEFLWNGLNCSTANTPRIISLNLSSSKLTGKMPASLSNLKALESLDLSKNELMGPIPDFLAQMSNLKFLDLSYNDLTGELPEFLAQLPNLKTLNLNMNKLEGSVPESLRQKGNESLVLSLGGNPDLCQSVSCEKKKKKMLVIPLVATSIVVLVLLFLFCAWRICRRKRREMVKESNIKLNNHQYSYCEVVVITNNFKTIIGEGGFGKVYLGILTDETQVAVKLLSSSSKQGNKEFRAEAQLLMRVHHKNLVSLVGYCDEGENKALIYEYMANGDLKHHLSVNNTNVLNWNERLQIAVDAAHGLEYLHNGCKPPIIHRDLKTSNILLNENMQAKIADFGLSRAFATENDSHVSTSLAGTLGYLDPESQKSGNLNKKSDVYSFGILLFELITGRLAIIRGTKENTHILDWVHPIIESGDIHKVVDPSLQGEFYTNSAWKAVEIAMSCTPSVAIQRPDMSQILAELKECLALEMSYGRNQRMETESNMSTSGIVTSLELESETSPHAR